MHTLNVIKNLEMMKRCWNDLSKKTTDWAEIRTTIEDQLTVQQSWNLHPRNTNLCQVKMEVKVVTASVIYAPVNNIQTRAALVIKDFEDTVNV